jgi:hypothetical protein
VRPTIVEAPVATAVRAAPSPAAGEMPPPVVAVAPVKTVDPAAELVDLLASRAAKAAPIAKAAPAVESEPQPAASFNVEPDQAVRAIETPAPAPIPDPAAELVDLLGSHAKKAVKKPPRASRPAAKAGPPAPPAAIEAAPPRLPLVADPAAELANLLESRFVPPPAPQVHRAPARARPPAPVRANAATAHNSKPAPATPAKPAVDPAAELFDMLEARAARTAPQPARQPIQTAQPAQAAEPLQATRPVRPAQPAAPSPRVADAEPLERAQPRRPEPIAASHLGKPASQPKAAAPKAAAPRRKKVPAAASADMPVTRLEAPAATEPSEWATAPKPGKASSRGPRRRDADQRPLPPALMLEPENNGPTPPLDFIPRPQALRPRMRDIRQDESLDGVQDILARLAKRG